MGIFNRKKKYIIATALKVDQKWETKTSQVLLPLPQEHSGSDQFLEINLVKRNDSYNYLFELCDRHDWKHSKEVNRYSKISALLDLDTLKEFAKNLSDAIKQVEDHGK